MEREELEALNVHELRVKARVMGVKAPTTKRQSQLVEEILQIQKGDLPAFKSNMGRPPKAKGSNFDAVSLVINESSLADTAYGEFSENAPAHIFESSTKVEGIGKEEYDILGVVREIGNKCYIYNYLQAGMSYAILPNDLRKNINGGDLVLGKAKAYVANYGILTSVKKQELNTDKKSVGDKAKRVICKDIKEMRDFVQNDEGVQKITVEVESNKIVFKPNETEIALYTKECEDIVKSYNMLLDAKNLIANLCKENKTFTIYFLDVEYIYSTMYMYHEMKKNLADINAGQYFKEVLSMIANSTNARVVMFQKENEKRSSYLDIILGKYCKM